jgi:hypothetical protein
MDGVEFEVSRFFPPTKKSSTLSGVVLKLRREKGKSQGDVPGKINNSPRKRDDVDLFLKSSNIYPPFTHIIFFVQRIWHRSSSPTMAAM